jgi:uncharacterized Zn finger protein (UPF0148 family)
VNPRQFCDCGRPTFRKQGNAFVCRRCYEIQSIYYQTNTARENRAALDPADHKCKVWSRTEETNKREMQYAEPYRVHLYRND